MTENLPPLPGLDNASIRDYLAAHPNWEHIAEAKLPYSGEAWAYNDGVSRGREISLLIHVDPSLSPRSEEYTREAYRMIGYLHLGLPQETPYEAVYRLVTIARIHRPGSPSYQVAMGEDPQ